MKTLRWFILLWPGIISGQWTSDFENNNLNQWEQSPAMRWEVSADLPLSGLFSLHHAFDNSGAGEDYIFTELYYPQLEKAISYSWRLRHSYNPSSGNNWQVYFMSEYPDKIIDAFVLGVNYEGSDDLVKLWQVRGGKIDELINTGINYEEQVGRENAPVFLVSRDPEGRWIVRVDITGDGSFLRSDEAGELEKSDGSYFGARYCYSSAQDRKLWMDDIVVEGDFYKDTLAPFLDSIKTGGLYSLNLYFNESVSIPGNATFRWQDLTPDTVIVCGREIQLSFAKRFPNRQNQTLIISGIEDMDGNVMPDTLAGFYQNLILFGEVLINEIMSDPEPAVYLPPCEYLELYNPTMMQIDISGWTISVNSKDYIIEEGILKQGEFSLLTSLLSECIYEGLNTVPVFTSSTALTNGGAVLTLSDQYGRLIHREKYRDLSDYDPIKGDGGWSLERIDPGLRCGGDQNWKISSDRLGGTPGRINSAEASNTDRDPPAISFVGFVDSSTVAIHFCESVYLEEGTEIDFAIEGLGSALPVFHSSPLVDEILELKMNFPILRDQVYSVKIEDLADCEGNLSEPCSVEFSLPVFPEQRNVILNEVMYDPFFGTEEYIELLNCSDSYIDLKDLKFSVDAQINSIASLRSMSECSHLLPPGDLAVFTKDEIQLREFWNLENDIDVVELSDWKSLPNGGGWITLFNRSDFFMEKIQYHDSMHHEFLSDPTGVALERISETGFPVRWMSAAASVSYGTPGRQNSQQIREMQAQSEIDIEPVVFSPDLDGYQDVTEIKLRNLPAGSVVNISVTDLGGGHVTSLIENGISGETDRYFWDGQDENCHLVLPGIYIIHIFIFDGFREKITRKSCAVKYH